MSINVFIQEARDKFTVPDLCHCLAHLLEKHDSLQRAVVVHQSANNAALTAGLIVKHFLLECPGRLLESSS